jgi:glucosylglycerol-phosphate synthase
MSSDLIILYHRQPFAEIVENGERRFVDHQSPNGILPSLRAFFDHVGEGTWIAWQEKKENEPFVEVMPAPNDANYKIRRIALTSSEIHNFYHVTAKEVFWPILHSFPSYHSTERADWQNFVDINRRFAEAAAEEASDDAIIWVHDYNLWLAPYWIRQLKPNAKIAFFHHTPFPAADIFNIIPWRQEILESLLSCDLVGFHIPRYAQNFIGAVLSQKDVRILEKVEVKDAFIATGLALAEPEMVTKMAYGNQEITIDAFPVGVDPHGIAAIQTQDDHIARVEAIRQDLRGRKMVFSVGRVDYVKGTLELLGAFDRLLEQRPDLHGAIKLVLGTVPAAKGMEVYTETQTEIEQKVGAINGRFAELDWIPVTLFTRMIPFEELIAYYECADVCLVTPLRDGLNLVAKEYIAAKAGTKGALVLSEFTGAAVELADAILTNPYSVESLDRSIEYAIDMTQEEAEARMGRLYDHIQTYTVAHWSEHLFEQFAVLRKNFLAKVSA